MKEVHDQTNVNCEELDGCDTTTTESSSSDFEDDDGPSTFGKDDEALLEEPLTEEEVEELVAELLENESKAAEAQEALESESLEKVEHDVREELAQSLYGDELEKAIADEMEAFKEEWENALDDLESESAELLEQLDGAGIDLPSIYKWIESQAPNGCCTEAWKKRTHWIGSQVTRDAAESIAHANEKLQVLRPVRRRHGKILEEGASGYLEKKLAPDDSFAGTDSSKIEWSSFNKLISGPSTIDKVSFGSKNWSSVYLASTPQQAAMMGINFPGVNEVEEIDEIDGDSGDPFVADAVANEKELDLSEEQRKKYRKVNEEDDAQVYRKLQHHLKTRRHRRKRSQGSGSKFPVKDVEDVNSDHDAELHDDCQTNCQSHEFQGLKRLGDFEDECRVAKKSKVMIDCDDDRADSLNDKNGPYTFKRTVMDIQPALQENGFQSVNNKLGSQIDVFHCTVCDKVVNPPHKHPLLEVLVCRECRCAVELKMSAKHSDSFCGWCGCSGDLINCRTCKNLFCVSCISRNLGKECLSGIRSFGWKCCCCSPQLLQPLTLEFKKAWELRDLTTSSSESSSGIDSDNTEVKSSGSLSSNRKKKKIRRILDDAELGEETKRKIAIEKERQERLKSLQAQWFSKSLEKNNMNPCESLPEGASSDVLGDASTGFIVNIVRERGEDAVRIPPSISVRLKAHQIAGIRFMWENIIQSITKVKAGDKGLGCILAHTMGLGKTLQVIALLYIIMRGVNLGLRTALIVVPVNVLHNWKHEFQKWSPHELKPLRVFMLDDVSRDCQQRAKLLIKWKRKGGVFLIGYSSFRHLCLGKNVKDHPAAKQICYALQEGPDILVCDEAHIIKNNFAEITQALKQVKCQRRIALTGSPLQNNLMEYYCMVDFVREGFLGSSHEFRNRFQNPIENGQHTNSTADDVRIMNQRSHILYEQLKGFVQRMDASVMKKDLPPKTVFVISVKLSPCQRKLYKAFLNFHGLSGDKVSSEGFKGTSFFALYQALAQILNHPWILQLMKQKVQVSGEDDDTPGLYDGSSDENTDFHMKNGERLKDKNTVPPRKSAKTSFHESWWKNILNEDIYQKVEYSGKMVLLLDILTMSAEVGDKVLVFSQSIATLDLIEYYLSKLPRRGKEGRHWKSGKDWYRIDGKTKGSDRQKFIELFNDPGNKRVKCTLISTKAGSLGINMYAANRVVIMDGLWNPTFELQAICRAWRYGQKKPVYAYRLMAQKTMEEKIYKRQVTKEGLAARVVDRQQVHRTVSKEEMLHLFEFGDDENMETLQQNGHGSNASSNGGKLFKQKLSDSPASCSSDKLMETLLSRHNSRWITNYHEHETLLQENEEEKLTKEEQDMAWEVFRKGLDPRKKLDTRKSANFEWEEVQRVSLNDQSSLNLPQHNPETSIPPTPGPIITPEPQPELESRLMNTSIPGTCVPLPVPRLRYKTLKRRCTLLSHRITLRSQETEPDRSTICGECAREIKWEDVGGPPGKIIPIGK